MNFFTAGWSDLWNLNSAAPSCCVLAVHLFLPPDTSSKLVTRCFLQQKYANPSGALPVCTSLGNRATLNSRATREKKKLPVISPFKAITQADSHSLHQQLLYAPPIAQSGNSNSFITHKALVNHQTLLKEVLLEPTVIHVLPRLVCRLLSHTISTFVTHPASHVTQPLPAAKWKLDEASRPR